MNGSQGKPRCASPTTFWRSAALALALLSSLLLTACGSKVITLEVSGAERDFESEPVRKANGEPFRIAMMDMYPIYDSSGYWLKGFAEELQAMGYLPESVDLENAPFGFDEYYRYLLRQDLGPYIALDDEPYYVYGTEEDALLMERLRERVAAGKIDCFVVTGTMPGTFLKEMNPGVPVLVGFASDPVASGIIDSAEDTGDENFWALVEPAPLHRQLDAYCRMFDVKKLGILASEEYGDIACVPEYEEYARADGIPFETLTFTQADLEGDSAMADIERRVDALLAGGSDTILLTWAAVNDDQVGALADYLTGRGIPCLIEDGDEYVEAGGFVCMSFYDYESYGHYIATILSNVLHGQKAGSQPCVYTSSMRIVLNLTTAKKLGRLTDFSFLQSADIVYR